MTAKWVKVTELQEGDYIKFSTRPKEVRARIEVIQKSRTRISIHYRRHGYTDIIDLKPTDELNLVFRPKKIYTKA